MRIAIDFAQIVPGMIMPVVASVARFGDRREARDAHRQDHHAEQKPHRTARSTEHAKLIATRGANSQELHRRATGSPQCLAEPRACSARADSVGFPGRSGWQILSALIRFWERERCRRPTLLIFEVE